MRAILGFVLAPLAPAFAAWLLSLAPALTGVTLPGSFLALSLLYGYPLAGLFGVPLYLLFHRKNWLRLWQVGLAGAAIGCVVPLALVGLVVAYKVTHLGFVGALRIGHHEMGTLIPFGAAVGALCASAFWLVALATNPMATVARSRGAA